MRLRRGSVLKQPMHTHYTRMPVCVHQRHALLHSLVTFHITVWNSNKTETVSGVGVAVQAVFRRQIHGADLRTHKTLKATYRYAARLNKTSSRRSETTLEAMYVRCVGSA